MTRRTDGGDEKVMLVVDVRTCSKDESSTKVSLR